MLLLTKEGALEIAEALDLLSEFVDATGVSPLLSVYNVENTANGDDVRVRFIPHLDPWTDIPHWLYVWAPDSPWEMADVGETRLLNASLVVLNAEDLHGISDSLSKASPDDATASVSIYTHEEWEPDEEPYFDVPIIWVESQVSKSKVPVLALVTTEQSGRIAIR